MNRRSFIALASGLLVPEPRQDIFRYPARTYSFPSSTYLRLSEAIDRAFLEQRREFDRKCAELEKQLRYAMPRCIPSAIIVPKDMEAKWLRILNDPT